ncbi:DUF1549 and DUF1553 domain-containing protein [Lignipirellula cremea]|uniref:DUF1549 and DUF1553 domain-containing protein n=1 Tax=Lignipirellula cremea TaxID=2528010 RepID=UPI001E645932|nr:DUF1549 and DUF1553 domain-containing protein [Lignipirellula cremea]
MKYHRPLCIFCWIAALSLLAMLCGLRTASIHAAETAVTESVPAGVKIVEMRVEPASIKLQHRFDYRQILVTGVTAEGQSVDLTRIAKLSGGEQVLEINEQRLALAKADGEGELLFEFDGMKQTIPVQVTGIGDPYETSFIRDVQPAFSKMGCNAGTCHGSKDGKNGFKLSLRGYDSQYDYRAFTDDIGARRFNRAAPDQSLMMLKATGSIPHVGGVRMTVDDPYYKLLREWIAKGVKYDGETSTRVASIEVHPQNPIVPRAGMKQQMRVVATYTDGAVRDVTREAFIESGNIEVIEASPNGVLTMLRRGEASVLVRYEGAYAATTLVVMGDRSEFVWEQQPTYNYIDQHVYSKLERMKIQPSELCTDEEFVRRVYLDLTGLPPTADQTRAFLANPLASKEKREALVDTLIGSPAYVDHWTNKWSDMLQVNRKFLGEEGAVALHDWIQHQVAANTPYDEICRQVITASGSNIENPPASYWKILRDPADAMENTTHLFLAVRFNCNKCHDHPFERWTQDQYYNLSAYFAQIGRKEDPAYKGKTIGGSAVEGKKPLVEVIFDSGAGEVTHDRTGVTAPPSFPYSHDDLADASASRREQLAQWITSPDNQYFARSYANRLWGYLFGPGIIEPIDDIRAGNPATNPELLDALTADFIAHDFDVQHMLRTICKSRTYQHSVRTNRWNDDDQINYSHALPRRLPAEVLYDAIHVATGSVTHIAGVPAGFHASQLPDVGVKLEFLDDFGRPVRESSCECERSSGMVLGPIMKLVNGPTVSNALADPQNGIASLVASQPDDRKLVDEMFLRFLSRHATEAEMKLGVEALQLAGEEQADHAVRLAAYEKQLDAKQADWEEGLSGEVLWSVLKPTEMKSSGGATFTADDDGVILVGGPNKTGTYTIVASSDLPAVTGIRLETLPDDSLTGKGPGRSSNGNFVLNEVRLLAAPAATPDKAEKLSLSHASADFSQSGWAVAGAIDGNAGTGWAISPEFGKPHTAVFAVSQAAAFPGGSRLTIELDQQYSGGDHQIGKFRLSATSSPQPASGSNLPDNIVAILGVKKADRTPAQLQTMADYYRQLDGEYQALQQAVAQSADALKNRRLLGAQDLAWALINNPSFLFNR